MLKQLRKMSIRYQLMLLNILVLLMVSVSIGWAINAFVKDTVEDRIINDLTLSTRSIQKMIDTAINFSIENHLKAIGEKNVEILNKLNQDVETGKMSLTQAKQLGGEILLSQSIGKTGYIYALNSQGSLDVHPNEKMKNRDMSSHWLSQRQTVEKQGFIEYNWKNPDETEERAKVLYMEYFEPWDWIVSVSSYREEFISLLDIKDLRSTILSIESATAFIIDGNGDFLIHPERRGNVAAPGQSDSWKTLFDGMKEQKDGSMKLLWEEAERTPPRERLFFFHFIKSFDWYIVSAAYSDEILTELNKIREIIFYSIIAILLFMLPFSLYLGNFIARPLVKLAREMKQATTDMFSLRVREGTNREIDILAGQFNAYMEKLESTHLKLDKEVGERIRAAEQLKIFKKVFDNALEGICVTDDQGNILIVNPAFSDITGYTRDEVVGQNPRVLKSEKHDDAFYEEMWLSLTGKGHWAGEIWNRRKSGEAYPEILNINSIRDDHGKATHFVAVFHDISEMKSQQEAIRHQAYHDALTGLPNRYLARDRLEMAIKRSKRQKSMVAVIFLDMDNFKYFNDSIGHSNGDTLLHKLGSRLRNVVREQDTVARLGGDEFLIIAVDIRSQQEILELVNRIFESTKDPFIVGEHELLVSLSLGISVYPNDGRTPEKLIKNADMAMYQSKSAGKNTYNMFTEELTRLAAYKMDMIKAFRTALSDREFIVYFQPKVDPVTGGVIGLEALIRWQKKDGTRVSPQEFIPMAEETGLILQLGKYVLAESCRALKQVRQVSETITMSVNLSPLEFTQPDIVDTITCILDENGLPGGALEVEITETTMMTDLEKTVKKLNILKEKGISIAIDDFGTGYSSLYYLKKMPISTLKIDKSFIDDITVDSSDAKIVETIILMAKNLGICVVAEGVETKAQMKLLKQYECELIQGYYYARPMPFNELIGFIENSGAQNDKS